MSYILDALKKAEAERNLGAVPTIHANPSVPALSAGGASLWRKMGLWAILLLLVTVALVAAWLKLVRPSVAIKAATSIPPTVAPPEQVVSNSYSSPAAKSSQSSTQVPAQEPATPAPHAAKKSAPPASAGINETPVSHKSKPTPLDNATVAAAHTRKKMHAQSTTTVTEPPILAFQDLPIQIQKEIPFFSVGGYIYSDNRADRSILINNRLLRDGDQIAPELILEKMTPTGIVLNYRGYRYRKAY